MIIFALIGALVNIFAAYFTKEGDSLNQKAVNLHMLEDVLGWLVVLIGAIIMRFTDIKILYPILSILVAVFIFKNAVTNFKIILELFLEKTPKNISIPELKEHILEIKDVKDVHHIHIWSIDGYNNYATMHIVTTNSKVKELVKNELKEHNIHHTTIEIESPNENCHDETCEISTTNLEPHHHHHHHH